MLEWIQENWWVVWLVLAGGLAVSEMLTLDMTLLMLAGGALAGAGAAVLFPGLVWVHVLVAVVVAVALLGVLRPEILRRLHKGPGYRSTFDQLLAAPGARRGRSPPRPARRTSTARPGRPAAGTANPSRPASRSRSSRWTA